jgi:hypothetical protein
MANFHSYFWVAGSGLSSVGDPTLTPVTALYHTPTYPHASPKANNPVEGLCYDEINLPRLEVRGYAR